MDLKQLSATASRCSEYEAMWKIKMNTMPSSLYRFLQYANLSKINKIRWAYYKGRNDE